MIRQSLVVAPRLQYVRELEVRNDPRLHRLRPAGRFAVLPV